MGIKLFYSNDMLSLSNDFAGRLRSAVKDPLRPATVFVPNPYLKDWLQMRLADRYGICANLEFDYLDKGLWKIASAIDGQRSFSLMQHGDLQLCIYYALSNLDRSNEDLKTFVRYLYNSSGEKREDHDQRAWQLADILAKVFMNYEVQRPELVDAWKKGKLLYKNDMELGQRSLYLTLMGQGGLCCSLSMKRATLYQRYVDIDCSNITADMPEVFLFCESQLSRFHAGLLFYLGRAVDIYLYQFNPCMDYWEDMETLNEEWRSRVRAMNLQEDASGEYIEWDADDNRLLQAWGRVGREDVRLMGIVEEASGAGQLFEVQWLESEKTPSEETVLSALQSQVLNRSSAECKIPQDRSLQIVRCPSLYREVEALYNNILYNLERDETLQLTDIGVFVPDMEAYGPVIKSVFMRDSNLPFSLVDFSAAADSLAGRAMMHVFECALSGFTRSALFGLFLNPCFQERFGIDADTADIWLGWAEKLCMYRAYGSEDLEHSWDAPFTWSRGLQRLRLGSIMESGETPDFSDIIPFADMHSSDKNTLGTFGLAVDLLHETALKIKKGPAGGGWWAHCIKEIIDDFIAVPEKHPEEAQVLEGLISSMEKLTMIDEMAGSPEGQGLSLSFIKEYVAHSLKGIPGFHGQYLVSGVNISSLVPRRQVPFRISYILGMNEGGFPGISESSSLDLLSEKRKIGDITRPESNRYLFLQILLQSRDRVYISHVNRDLQKDQKFAPNSVVQQLVSYLDDTVLEDKFVFEEVPYYGYSTGYLQKAAAGAGLSDYVAVQQHGEARIINYRLADTALMLAQAGREGSRLPQSVRDLVITVTEKKAPELFGPHTNDSGSTPEREVPPVSLGELRNFLIDPAQASIRRHLRLYDYRESGDALYADQGPFFTEFPYSYELKADLAEAFIDSGSEQEALEIFEENYRRAGLKGKTAQGPFSVVDRESLVDSFSSYIKARKENRKKETVNPSLVEVMAQLREHEYYRSLSLSFSGPGQEGLHYSPAVVSLKGKGDVEVTGSLSHVWKEQGGGCHCLVLTGASKLNEKYFFSPFLFYALAATAFHGELHGFLCEGPFAVHVSTGEGVRSRVYDLDRETAREYFINLMRDFLDDHTFDLFPMEVVFNQKIKVPSEISPSPGQDEIVSYYNAFVETLQQELENNYRSYSLPDLAAVADPRIPEDACEKARRRFALLAGISAREKDT